MYNYAQLFTQYEVRCDNNAPQEIHLDNNN